MNENTENTDAVHSRDRVEDYYRPPGFGDGHGSSGIAPRESKKSNHFVLGLILLCLSVAANFTSFAVGMFVMDPESSLDEQNFLNEDPTTITDEQLEVVLRTSAPLRYTQALFSMLFSAISMLGCVAAIGLMRGKRSGRLLTIVWAGLALLFLAAELIVHYSYIFPDYVAVMTRLDDRCGEACTVLLESICGMSTSFDALTFPFFEAPFFVLPILLLVFATRKRMIEGCTR